MSDRKLAYLAIAALAILVATRYLALRSVSNAWESEDAVSSRYFGFVRTLEAAGDPKAAEAARVGAQEVAAERKRIQAEFEQTAVFFRVTGLVGLVLLALVAWLSLRRAAERDEQQRFIDSILEHIPDMVFLKDAVDLRFVRFNRAGERLLGLSRESLIGRNDYDFFPKEQADFFTSKDREVLASGALLDIPEEPIATPYGRRLLHTKKIPILGADGTPRYLLGISEDITELRRAQLSQKELVAMMTHELRTPLHAISVALTLLDEHIAKDGTGVRQMLDAALRNNERIMRLIEDFFDLEKLEYGQIEFHSRVEDLRHLIEQAVKAAAPAAARVGVRLETSLPQEPARAEVDHARLQQVFSNLIGNALRFSPSGGAVRIALERREAFFRVSVIDQGPGIPEAFQPQVFKKFARGDYGGASKGAGLGLSICKAIVERMGGVIGFASKPGDGATFYFDLRSA